MDDLAEVYPACVAMYTEEVGVSPESGGGAELYRTRVSQLISRGWSFARFDHGRLVFKARWRARARPRPRSRACGCRRTGAARASASEAWPPWSSWYAAIAPVVALYVNEYNLPARQVYEQVGFRQSATFATVMF